ncbi:MAG: hypothetical protein R2690_08820 [Acidimicrobiales bacterium]
MKSAQLLAEISISWPLIVVIAIVVIGGGLVIVASFTRRDTDTAVGFLARETVKRDKPADLSPAGQQPAGREIERLAEAERKGELVTVAAPGEVAPSCRRTPRPSACRAASSSTGRSSPSSASVCPASAPR